MDKSLLTKSDFSHKYFSTVKKLIENSNRILVWGDEDTDGITSTAIMLRILKKIGKKADYFIPSRKKDGIGISENGLKRIKNKKFDLIITVDCGSVNSKEIAALIKRKMKIIITDHHIPYNNLIAGVPYINPHILKTKKFQNLSGAGIAFVLGQYLLNEFNVCKNYSESLNCDKKSIFLAGLGTKCDRVNENEISSLLIGNIKKYGKYFPEFHSLGIVESDLCSVVTSSKTRISRNTMVEIFTEKADISEDKKTDYIKICYEKARDYRKRVNEIYRNIKSGIELTGKEKRILIVDKKIEYKYIGVLASMLTEEISLPVCIVGRIENKLMGECRSKIPYNWVNELKMMKEFFISWGGHPQAAGFILKGDKVEHFIIAFKSVHS